MRKCQQDARVLGLSMVHFPHIVFFNAWYATSSNYICKIANKIALSSRTNTLKSEMDHAITLAGRTNT